MWYRRPHSHCSFFFQLIIFVKSVERCKALTKILNDQKFPCIAIHGRMEQTERLANYSEFKDFKKRILVATELFARGMDIERVNIVINYDMPADTATYLHRVARAGRFGTKVLNESWWYFNMFISKALHNLLLYRVLPFRWSVARKMRKSSTKSKPCSKCHIHWRSFLAKV